MSENNDDNTEQATPVEPVQVESDSDLGDAGKKALDAERRRAHAAEREAKALKARLDEIEAAQLSKEERLAKEAEAARAEAESERRESRRWKVAAQFGVPSEDAELILTASDEETLTRQAQRYQELASRSIGGAPIPGIGNRPAAMPSLQEQIRAAEVAGDFAQAMSLKAQQLAELARKNK